MRQVLRAGALGRPRGMGWGGRQEGGSGRGTHVNPWLIHVNVWQKPLQYYNIVISLQLIKINGKKNKKKREVQRQERGPTSPRCRVWLPGNRGGSQRGPQTGSRLSPEGSGDPLELRVMRSEAPGLQDGGRVEGARVGT